MYTYMYTYICIYVYIYAYISCSNALILFIFGHYTSHVKIPVSCIQLQHTATHCNTLQHAARHCKDCSTLQHTAAHCNTLQHTATHDTDQTCIQHHTAKTAAHGNTLQHTATHDTDQTCTQHQFQLTCKDTLHTKFKFICAKTSPCVIFIDELDALGKSRGNGMQLVFYVCVRAFMMKMCICT